MSEQDSKVMNAMNTKPTIVCISMFAAAASLVLVAGCNSQKQGTDGTAPAEQTSGLFPHVKKNGGQIWAENCNRCHYARPASQYSAQQWDMIELHMRSRADMTGEEQRAVYHFLSGT